MCVVSNVGDWGRTNWPLVQPPTWQHTIPFVPVIPKREEWDKFKDLVEKAREFDEATNQPACEDPEKTLWMEEMERRVSELEAEKAPKYPFFDFGYHADELVEVLSYLLKIRSVFPESPDLGDAIARMKSLIQDVEKQFD